MAITVLLADDHAMLRDGLRLILTTQPDIRVVAAVGDGRSAVQQAQESLPDVVVLDIAMPELNGIEAARQIAAALPDTKIVMLTMYGTREHIFRALRAGARGYLLKESAGAEIIEAVRAVDAGQHYLSRSVTEVILDDYISLTEQASRPLDRLSEREREVVQFIVAGKSGPEIAAQLHLSPKSIDTYRRRAMQKLGVTDLAGLIRFAMENGLV